MGGSLSETDSLSMASFELDFVELQDNPVRTGKSKRIVIKEELEEAKSVYQQAFEALKAAASKLGSKKEEYLQLLEDERKELDAEIASVKAFKEVTWPAKAAAQEVSANKSEDEGEGKRTREIQTTGGADSEQDEKEAEEDVEGEEEESEEFDLLESLFALDNAGEEDGEDGMRDFPRSEAEEVEGVEMEEGEKEEGEEEKEQEGMLVYVLWKCHNDGMAYKLPTDNTLFDNKHEKGRKNRVARKLVIQATADDTVSIIKQKLRHMMGIEVPQQKLFSSGRRLNDKNTLAFYNIKHNSILHLKPQG